MPRHVEDGFLESERERRDSGVLATKGIVGVVFGVVLCRCLNWGLKRERKKDPAAPFLNKDRTEESDSGRKGQARSGTAQKFGFFTSWLVGEAR